MHLFKVLRTVLWSLTGIGRREHARDLEGVGPASFIAVGLFVAALLVAGIVTLVLVVTRDAGRARVEALPAGSPSLTSKQHGPISLRDTVEERVLACTQCHSSETQVTKDGFSPRIAGKPAGYLF